MKSFVMIFVALFSLIGCSYNPPLPSKDHENRQSVEKKDNDKRNYEIVKNNQSKNVIVTLRMPISANDATRENKLKDDIQQVLNTVRGIRLKHQLNSIYGFSAEVSGEAYNNLIRLDSVKAVRIEGFSPTN